MNEVGPDEYLKRNPYAEWYLNTLRIPDSPTKKYQKETYGENFSYDDFVPMFNEAIEKWDPDQMADLFKKAGAKYVVLVTKHHDGFLLWPSKYPNPNKKNYMASRNIAGELTDAVKNKGMKMAFYYSGVLDWSFNPNPIKDAASFLTNGISTPEYIEYANNHWYELIDKYEPLILWNDIGYPPNTNVYEIFAYYLNKIPEGVINDRWVQTYEDGKRFTPYSDYKTPEYITYKTIKKKKWETTRGIGNSFGYNKFEKEKDYLSPEELIRMFVDVVSKNGNLLLNVGPMADGTIPEIQKKCLLELGKWLEVNGEAIYGTRPWEYPEGKTIDNIEVRYTQKKDALYAFLLDKPQGDRITIQSFNIEKNSRIQLLGQEKALDWKQEGEKLTISMTESLINAPAYAFKITPKT
jgi:alpha-L-fucosidase